MIDKRVRSLAEAVAGIKDGAVVLTGGFGGAGSPEALYGALLEQGATHVYACASHAVLSGEAVERIANSRLEQLIVTDSIPLKDEAKWLRDSGKIKVLSVAGLLGAAILSIHMETSVSTLFS